MRYVLFVIVLVGLAWTIAQLIPNDAPPEDIVVKRVTAKPVTEQCPRRALCV